MRKNSCDEPSHAKTFEGTMRNWPFWKVWLAVTTALLGGFSALVGACWAGFALGNPYPVLVVLALASLVFTAFAIASDIKGR